jgi:hypothetical protein
MTAVHPDVGIALVALVQHELHAGDAFHAGLQQQIGSIMVLELVGVEHVADRLVRDLGAGLRLRIAALAFGSQRMRSTTPTMVDLAADPVPDLHRLMARLQHAQLFGVSCAPW